jgi:hypothetical protein
MKINTENDGVFTYLMTVDTAREFPTDHEVGLLTEALDEAQAHVFGGDGDVAYLIIEIRKELPA